MRSIRASRKLLENPYAHIEELDAAVIGLDVCREGPFHFAPRPMSANAPRGAPPVSPTAHASSGNPYASLATIEEDEDGEIEPQIATLPSVSPTAASGKRSLREEVSRADFRTGCISIFLPYIPPHLPRRILQHHRDFIARNERRSPNARFRVLAELRRYDLSSTPGITPQFNRELRADLSEEKLRRVEADAGVD